MERTPWGRSLRAREWWPWAHLASPAIWRQFCSAQFPQQNITQNVCACRGTARRNYLLFMCVFRCPYGFGSQQNERTLPSVAKRASFPCVLKVQRHVMKRHTVPKTTPQVYELFPPFRATVSEREHVTAGAKKPTFWQEEAWPEARAESDTQRRKLPQVYGRFPHKAKAAGAKRAAFCLARRRGRGVPTAGKGPGGPWNPTEASGPP